MDTDDLNMLKQVALDLHEAVLDGNEMHGFITLRLRCRHHGQMADQPPVTMDVPQALQLVQLLQQAVQRLQAKPPQAGAH